MASLRTTLFLMLIRLFALIVLVISLDVVFISTYETFAKVRTLVFLTFDREVDLDASILKTPKV